ncbi:MAG TPA: hypothetical protein VGB64_16015 [Actinomycetota bacterium]
MTSKNSKAIHRVAAVLAFVVPACSSGSRPATRQPSSPSPAVSSPAATATSSPIPPAVPPNRAVGLPGGCSGGDPPAQNVDRALSSSERGIAFARLLAEGQKPGIYVAGRDGSDVRPFIPCGVSARGPVWSPSGDRLAFQLGDGQATEVYLVNKEGSGMRRLTRNDMVESALAWSPDGKRLAFIGQPKGTANQQQIHVVDVAGGTPRRLSAALDLTPSFSPDGARIIFVRIDPSTYNSAVWEMRIDGSDARRILPGYENVSHPQYSPDGRRILLSDGKTLFHVATDGSSKRTIATLTADVRGGIDDPRPAWSSDGALVVFNQRRAAATNRSDIWIVGADGSGLRRLLESPGLDTDPSWQAG